MPHNLNLTIPQQERAPIYTSLARATGILTLALLVSASAFFALCSPAIAEKKFIVIQSTMHEIKAPRDSASGVATGRKATRNKALDVGRQGGHMTILERSTSPKPDVLKPAKVEVPKVSTPAGNLGTKDIKNIKVNAVR